MSKVKYKFNTRSLTYEKVEVSWKSRIFRFLSHIMTGLVFATVTIWFAFEFIESPRIKQQKREIEAMKLQYELLNKRFEQAELVMEDIQLRDDNIYRMIFETEPIPENIRKAGFGGVDRYKALQKFDNAALMTETTKKLDRLTKQLYVQSKSFDDVVKLVKNKEKMLASIPAIQPISNKNLRHAPSGFGMRTHPIYKQPEFHPGMDFTAPTGTEIYATGDGVVERADAMVHGYGNHVVISHGFGYQTLYGHMSKIKVRQGQKVKRGQLIGLVGSTGLSTAPHVHYEVIKNGNRVNPINYYYNDLTPAEYAKLIELSSKSSQSFD